MFRTISMLAAPVLAMTITPAVLARGYDGEGRIA